MTFKSTETLQERIARAKQQVQEAAEKKKQTSGDNIDSVEKKILTTEKLIEQIDSKIEKLSQQKVDLIRKNQNRLKYLNGLAR